MKKYKNEELFDEKKTKLTTVDKWARTVTIATEMFQRKHKFSCGTKGHVVKEINIKIKFPKGVDVQPHMDFEYAFALACAKTVEEEIDGYFDAQ